MRKSSENPPPRKSPAAQQAMRDQEKRAQGLLPRSRARLDIEDDLFRTLMDTERPGLPPEAMATAAAVRQKLFPELDPARVLKASQEAAIACMLLAQEYERHLQELLRMLNDGDYEDALDYVRSVTSGPAIPLEVDHAG